jgi:hypothetical protein
MHAAEVGPQWFLEEPVFQMLKKAFRGSGMGEWASIWCTSYFVVHGRAICVL